MRTSILSAAFVAALAVAAWSPARADAQVIINPTVTTSPYAYASYWNPGYRYAYTWSTPYYSAYTTSWSNPLNYGTWTWYNTNPYYYSSYRYGGWPYGGRGYYWRW